MIRKAAAIFILSTLAVCAAGQDPELTNYKSGISLTFSGVEGEDWKQEAYFHDASVGIRGVTYILDTTQITLSHNARNSVTENPAGLDFAIIGANGVDGIAGNADDGTIRYKIDGDLSRRYAFSGSSNLHPAYSSALTFATMTYPDDASAVVGSTGGNGESIADPSLYYHRGILDAVGDEYHTLTVADDDRAWLEPERPESSERWAGDAKMHLFVVNPKTPCLSVSATGDGQFFTTPAKVYYAPVIHDQTTYFDAGTGSVSFELESLQGSNVFYRIVSDPNDAVTSYTDAGADVVTLTQTDFSTGTQYLQYYYAGNSAYTKTRTVVKDPSFPSAGETHGNIYWGSAEELANITSRLSEAPYSTLMDSYRANLNTNWNTWAGQGYRTPHGPGESSGFVGAARNAFVALIDGWTTIASGDSKRNADYAKEMLLENLRSLDPVDHERNHNGSPIGTREIQEAGYYTYNHIADLCLAYDIMISGYKDTQQTGGITPIEDYFIRDSLASFVHESMQWYMGLSSDGNSPDMWGTAKGFAAVQCMLVMPDYDTEYYGKSGVNGGTASYTWTPFQTSTPTWWEFFGSGRGSITTTAYPDIKYQFRPELQNFEATGEWKPRHPYFGRSLMGHTYHAFANIMKRQTGETFPLIEGGCIGSIQGTLLDKFDAVDTKTRGNIQMINSEFPFVASAGTVAIAEGTVDTETSIADVFDLIWYDNSYNPIANNAKRAHPRAARGALILRR